MRKEVFVGFFGVFFLGLLYFAIIYGVVITGKVVFEPDIAEECDINDLKGIWGDIFVVSVSDVVIYNESFSSGEDCSAYIMFKNDTNNFIYVVLREDSLEEQRTWAYYVEGNETLVSSLNSVSDYSSGKAFVESSLLNNIHIVDRSIGDSSAAETEFTSVFNFVNPSSFSTFGDGYRFIEIDTYQGGGPDKAVTGHVVSDESINYIQYINYTSIEEIEIEDNITDFTFEANSSWNFAFDYRDYFDYEGSVNFGVDSYGTNNSDGEWISYSESSGDVSFRPKQGFVGSRDFILFVNNSYSYVVSNEFKVNIVNELPQAPRIYSDFENIFLKENDSLVIKLEDHFADSDSTSITYNYTGGDTLDISISGSTLTIGLESNFTTFDSFFIGASDGTLSIISDEIFVFLDENPFEDLVSDTGTEGKDDEDLNSSLQFDTNSSLNESLESENVLGVSRENLRLIIYGSSIFVTVASIGYLIYFLVNRKRVDNKPQPELINNYLEKLKGKGEVTTFESVPTKKVVSPKIIPKVVKKAIIVKPKPTISKPKDINIKLKTEVSPIKRVIKKVVKPLKRVNLNPLKWTVPSRTVSKGIYDNKAPLVFKSGFKKNIVKK